ncbi:MAG: PhzF family phenazine biosynthesis protein [Alicyclobacillus sp.]|nr:PhzF family phenazine biosynthesis protein [Alicyclobacillus sp.]
MTTVWLVDAFTTEVFGGNPAGVVPDASGLSDRQMQAIAAELGASETAFVLPVPNVDGHPTEAGADVQLRYFTPTCEVDLCGHATIGAVCGLLQDGRLTAPPGESGRVLRIATRVGVLPVMYGVQSGFAWAEMGQAPPLFREVEVDTERLCAALGIEPSALDATLPLGLAYTGLWDLFVPVRTLAGMAALRPAMERLADWNRELGVASTHVYSAEVVEPGHHYHARDFSPALGIPEDPATGTASGALLALLHRAGRVDVGDRVVFEQGYEIGRPSQIHARLAVTPTGREGTGDVAVYVGGHAVRSLRGELQVH